MPAPAATGWTKLLTCGPNTNPWYAECSDRICRQGEMIAFDTDMIGPYGYCADLSRSWTCGYTKMTPKQAEHYAAAVEQVSETGCESIKLETQVLISENRPERLDRFPWERL
jgi:Xaa-Pro aminopeptidase